MSHEPLQATGSTQAQAQDAAVAGGREGLPAEPANLTPTAPASTSVHGTGAVSLARRNVGGAQAPADGDEDQGRVADDLLRTVARANSVPISLPMFREWRQQHAVLTSVGVSQREVIAHLTTFLIGAQVGRDSVASCGDCGHSPHVGVRDGGCTAFRELDDGPHICGCDVGEYD